MKSKAVVAALGLVSAVLITRTPGAAATIGATTGHSARLAPATVTLILKEGFTRRDLIAIVRRSGLDGQNLIAVTRSDLTPDLLATAFAELAKSLRKDGDRPTRRIDLMFTRSMKIPRSSGIGRTVAERSAADLLAAPLHDIPQIGRFPAITLVVGN